MLDPLPPSSVGDTTVRTGEDSLWEQAVRDACARPGHIRPHFQPVVDLRRGVVAGYEALARFAGPPSAPPDRWFAVARSLGLADQLEARALTVALAARSALPPNTFLSVNVSPQALAGEAVRRVFAAAGDLRGVVVEITEQVEVEDYGSLLNRLEPLRAAGALIAVDDVGAGFASLRHVMSLKPSFVKIDRLLVSGMDRDEVRAAVVETLGFFASRLDAWVIAEGVETSDERDRLRSLDVPLAQGFGLGRPGPAMVALAPEVSAALAARAPAADTTLARLSQPVGVLRETASRADISREFLSGSGHEWLALVDEHQRPVALAGRDRTRPAMCIGHTADPADVAARAMTRPEDERFDPLLVCDDLGRLSGLVPVEHLVLELARDRPA